MKKSAYSILLVGLLILTGCTRGISFPDAAQVTAIHVATASFGPEDPLREWTISDASRMAQVVEFLVAYEEGWKAYMGTHPSYRYTVTFQAEGEDLLRLWIGKGYISNGSVIRTIPDQELRTLRTLLEHGVQQEPGEVRETSSRPSG
jgi:hypothetical protein